MVELIIIIAVAVVLLVGGGFYYLRSRDGGATLLEPPPARPRPEGGTDVLEAPAEADVIEALPEPEVEPEPVKLSFRDRLAKARGAFTGYFGSILSRGVDAQTWEELEETLIRADVGVPTTISVLDAVRAQAEADGITEPQLVLDLLRAELKSRLADSDRSLHFADRAPSVWLFVGVNGVGKTTTIGKLAHRQTTAGRNVVLAAGDTFRAAAAEQLGTWAERADAALVRGNEGGDPSAVIFDAVEHAAAKDADLVLADTAGRLHTKSNLMEELSKVRRVAEKGAGTVSEVLLVLDATTGQNGLTQAQQFTEAVDVTGVVLTKLDGSAKGGIVLAVQSELGIPVKLVGLGEGIDDLIDFDSDEFVDALF
ncbi:MAG: signal recognition particle-docking protein FtsY [Acidimicrobiales bacterium]|nr:signal recognition particle-docking protein FtsY [Acidimicrobiales bacterium]